MRVSIHSDICYVVGDIILINEHVNSSSLSIHNWFCLLFCFTINEWRYHWYLINFISWYTSLDRTKHSYEWLIEIYRCMILHSNEYTYMIIFLFYFLLFYFRDGCRVTRECDNEEVGGSLFCDGMTWIRAVNVIGQFRSRAVDVWLAVTWMTPFCL